MCRAVNCPTCKRPDWRGCGAHIEQVLGHVPKDQRCQCRSQGKSLDGPSVWSSLKQKFFS